MIEVWVEKNLDEEDNPLLERLCEEVGVNLVTGIEFMTIASFHALLNEEAPEVELELV